MNNASQSSSSAGSACQYIKRVQQLVQNALQQIQSDEQQLISQKKMNQLRKIFTVLNKINVNMTNREKLQLIMRNSYFQQRVLNKLEQKILYSYPIVKIKLVSSSRRQPVHHGLEQNDLVKAFSRFGNISNFLFGNTYSYILYDNHFNAYMASASLNGLEIQPEKLALQTTYCSSEQVSQVIYYFNIPTALDAAQRRCIPQKFTCKYEICFQNLPEFKLSNKIIGPNGKNMKNIIQKVMRGQSYSEKPKLRLRGKGSGFREGINQKQVEEPLHLCVSTKYEKVYREICLEVEQLLAKISQEFWIKYSRNGNLLLESIAYKKIQLINQREIHCKEFTFEAFPQSLLANEPQLSQKAIEMMVGERNIARRKGNFKQADSIREKLKRKGILLVDQKQGYITKWRCFHQ